MTFKNVLFKTCRKTQKRGEGIWNPGMRKLKGFVAPTKDEVTFRTEDS